MEKVVLPLHFEDRPGVEFERLVFAHLARQKNWTQLEWLGQNGKDSGRDIWGEAEGETYCYLCANYRRLILKKGKDDIDRLVETKYIPDNLIIVCGGTVVCP